MLQPPPLFADRRAAGRALAARLQHYAGRDDVVILVLPRGGVPVGYEVALSLNAPLGVFLVRKLGAPGHRELAMGAIASGGIRVVNEAVVRALGVTREQLDAATQVEQVELARQQTAYGAGRYVVALTGRTPILVDDGLATGSTMQAAVEAVKTLGPTQVVVAVPVAAQESRARMNEIADEAVCLYTPAPFTAVGQWYANFDQTTDDEVRRLLSSLAS